MKSIPYYLYRGGTSKGPFLFKKDLPKSDKKCNQLIRNIMGSPHPYQVDGIGGGVSNASKVGIINLSDRPDCDIDCLFGQVAILSNEVDLSGDCGNMLTAAACCAIEAKLINATKNETKVRVFNPATNSVKEVVVPCKNGSVIYEGQYHIDGVNSSGSKVYISFLNPGGSQTGHIFPSGHRIDIVNNIPVTLIDCGRALIIAQAHDFNIQNKQTNEELEQDFTLQDLIEKFRLACAKKMNIKNPCQTYPRIVLVSKSNDIKNNIHVRYWSNPTAKQIHPSLAMTAAIGISTALVIKGTICAQRELLLNEYTETKEINIGHPQGGLEISITGQDFPLNITKGTYYRTARLIAKGEVYYSES